MLTDLAERGQESEGRTDNKFHSSAMNVDHEVKTLVEEITRLGTRNAEGKLAVRNTAISIVSLVYRAQSMLCNHQLIL